MLLSLVVNAAEAQSLADETTGKSAFDDGAASEWELSLTPYFWATAIEGDSTVGPFTSNIDVSFNEFIDEFDVLGGMARFEATQGKFAFFLDGAYVDADTSREFTVAQGPVSVRTDIDIGFGYLEFGSSYRAWQYPFENSDKTFDLEVLAGGRYTHFEQSIGVQSLGPLGIQKRLGGNADWVDPIVGARIKLDLTDHLALRAYGDIGGFGIGEAADPSWKARALLDWQITRNMALLGGYQVYGLDFEDGSGRGRIGFDGEFHGPIFGLGIRF
jgi:hypothetical protein